LDVIDQELEKRGYRFIRCYDNSIILVKSQRSGDRILSSITSFLEKRLKLIVNETKNQVVQSINARF